MAHFLHQPLIMSYALLVRAGAAIEDLHQCRYTLLHYLDVYNLKPPAAPLFLYTDQPAVFESYQPYFSDFRMLPLTKEPLETLLQKAVQVTGMPVLYLGPGVYTTAAPQQLAERAIATPSLLWNRPVPGATNRRKPAPDALPQLAAAWITPAHLPLPSSFLPPSEAEADTSGLAPYITVYPHSKAFVDLLDYFFVRNAEESIPNLLKLLHHLNAEALEQDRSRFAGQPFYKKWLQQLTGTAWNLNQYKKRL